VIGKTNTVSDAGGSRSVIVAREWGEILSHAELKKRPKVWAGAGRVLGRGGGKMVINVGEILTLCADYGLGGSAWVAGL